MTEELPENVRRVPGPAVHWTLQTSTHAFDGYVFDDDPSDLAKFLRWLAQQPLGRGQRHVLLVNEVMR